MIFITNSISNDKSYFPRKKSSVLSLCRAETEWRNSAPPSTKGNNNKKMNQIGRRGVGKTENRKAFARWTAFDKPDQHTHTPHENCNKACLKWFRSDREWGENGLRIKSGNTSSRWLSEICRTFNFCDDHVVKSFFHIFIKKFFSQTLISNFFDVSRLDKISNWLFDVYHKDNWNPL